MQRGRRIAFDYGDARIGVAASDQDSILVSPLTTLATSSRNLLKEIAVIFEEISPIQIYVGKPTNLSGVDSTATSKVLNFIEDLKKITETPIILIDERMSTVSASRSLREAGLDSKKSKSIIDMAAAVAILEFAITIEKGKS
ncbi:MAG: Holliday junction resolvase RuvX [Streptomycetaceae bacterium]|jgi:putative Holliday junction resolvase|nr:Holliday junction resolvase RuvX [Streptomycetaceae bacterium]